MALLQQLHEIEKRRLAGHETTLLKRWAAASGPCVRESYSALSGERVPPCREGVACLPKQPHPAGKCQRQTADHSLGWLGRVATVRVHVNGCILSGAMALGVGAACPRDARALFIIIHENLEGLTVVVQALACALQRFVGLAQPTTQHLDEAPQQFARNGGFGADEIEKFFAAHDQ